MKTFTIYKYNNPFLNFITSIIIIIILLLLLLLLLQDIELQNTKY